MKRVLFFFLTSLIALAVMAGCGRTTAPGNVTFSDTELTAIAGTAQASVQQTALAASPTPVPSTSTPQVSPISGTSLVVREDQTALFIDHRAGIQLITPAGWLPVRVNEDEYYKAFTLEAVMANQAITDRLTQIQSNNTDVFRLDVIDMRPGYTVDDIMAVISVVFQENDNRTLEAWLKAERARKSPFKGFKFISSKYQETADGTRVLVIEQSWDATHSGTIYYRGVFFSLPSGTVVLDFFANFDFKDTVLPEFEQVVNSLTLLNP